MIQLSDNAIKTLSKRYFLKDKNGNCIEDWELLCLRVSSFISQDEKEEDKKKWCDIYFDMMYNLRFIPNTPTIVNAGKKDGQLAACFVLPIEDDIKSIMKTLTDTVIIHKSGGGTGFNFSKLRPKNSRVNTTSGVASGPVSFMKMYNAATEEIKQGGARRGANMAILRIDHPDILEFINCKSDQGKFNNFNISVAITDKFMESLKNKSSYKLISPIDGSVVGELKAEDVFNKIVENAHNNGEPGLFFIDTANHSNCYGEINATNPCGEQPLRDYEACTLGSMNISAYVNNGTFNETLFRDDVSKATRFLDSVISLNCYPIEEIKKSHLETRKIGLGIMGLADFFIKMNVVYGSNESYSLAENIYKILNDVSKKTSAVLGREKGICDACKSLGIERRNLYTTTIAPTGSISIIAGCSGGIEPLFMIGFVRNILDNDKLKEFHMIFREMMGDKLTPEIENKIIGISSIQNVLEIPNKIKRLFVTASDVTIEQHIKMQSIFQKYSDSGVSKTINMSKVATKDDVRNAFLSAYKLKCKGITVYRDGSRDNQPMAGKESEYAERKKFNRTKIMSGTTEKIDTTLGDLLLTINNHAYGEPGEVIINIGKSGLDIHGFSEAIGRLISVMLQHGVPAHKIGRQLKGIQGEDAIFYDGKKYTSILDLIGCRLSSVIKKEKSFAPCPVCGEKMYKAEGCSTCLSCGYSRC